MSTSSKAAQYTADVNLTVRFSFSWEKTICHFAKFINSAHQAFSTVFKDFAFTTFTGLNLLKCSFLLNLQAVISQI